MNSPALRVNTDIEGIPPGELAMLLKVARLYHEQGLRQPAVAELLHMSQSRVSRMLSQAVRLGIVRTTVVAPKGLFPELEDTLRALYGARDVVVVDAQGDDDAALLKALGATAGQYLEVTLTGNDKVGLSSWSATLLEMVNAMSKTRVRTASDVVQLIGGVGVTTSQINATRLIDRLARQTGATAHFVAAPGLVSSKAARDALLEDENVRATAAMWSRLSLAVVGIGSVQPSPMLKNSGNSVSETEAAVLRGLGAVGDVCLRFIDEKGDLVLSEMNDRVLGVSPEEYLSIPRRMGVAAGARKKDAIRAAMRGGWINILITDREMAAKLVEDP